MIQERTILNVVDNSGVKKVRVFRVLRKKKYARIGDIVVASVREKAPGSRIKKREVKPLFNRKTSPVAGGVLLLYLYNVIEAFSRLAGVSFESVSNRRRVVRFILGRLIYCHFCLARERRTLY